MRIAFFVNDIPTEEVNYTTTVLALEAVLCGHDVFYIGAGDFAYDPDNHLRAHAYQVPRKKFESTAKLLQTLQSDKVKRERITVDELDVLMLRNDPARDAEERPWAATSGIVFGQVAASHGALVLNDPTGLSGAMNKLYLQEVPPEVRPRTLITRDRSEVRSFVKDVGYAVIKPLQGSGGQNVFLVDKQAAANLNQMMDVVIRQGYVIVQEYLPAAEKGDTRLFLLKGKPLELKGKYAAIARLRSDGDLRSNMHAGGKAAKAKINGSALRIAEIIRPKLVRDGMYLVGLDIAGDKLMEINVFSPGGLHTARKLTQVNFARLLIEDLERKVTYRRMYGPGFTNAELAML